MISYNLFTTGENMKHYFKIAYFYYMYIMIFFDFMQFNFASILKATGNQNYASKVFFFIYYILGVPLNLFMLKWNGMEGIWQGMLLLSILNNILQYYKICRFQMFSNFIIIIILHKLVRITDNKIFS